MFFINKISFKKLIILISSIVILIIFSIITIIHLKYNPVFSSTSTAMGTYVTQTVYCKSPENICSKTMNSIKDLENKISWRIIDSDINKINSAPENLNIKVSKETINILEPALNISTYTHSAFNPAILPLSKLWDFAGPNQRVPSQNEINEVLPHLNIDSLKLDKSSGSILKTDPHTMIDLGAIGKGTACDTAVKIYQENNITGGVICVGGSIGIYGTKHTNEPWKIAIRNPFITDDNNSSFAVLNVKSGFISTSGAYERNFIYDDKFYHHILSTSTGYPVENNIESVTVYASNGTLSDILSTACYVLGIENSKPLLKKFNATAIFVNKNKSIVASTELKNILNITDASFFVSSWV